jgi:AraC-like DNA-binding protein
MRIAGRGRIVVWEGASLWVLAALRDDAGTDFHTHHAIQVTLALEGGFVVRAPDESSAGPVTLVAADSLHMFEATGAAAFLFVEPESPAGRVLTARFRANAHLAEPDPAPLLPLMGALRECLAAQAPASRLIAIGRELLAALAPAKPSKQLDSRVQTMIAFVRANLDGALTLDRAAVSACLSPSRARHLFAAEAGLPFKAYVLWERLERAVEHYAAGHSLTEAAHEAGFADSAHLSRTFRKTFGIPASWLEVGWTYSRASSRARPARRSTAAA